MYLDRHMLQFDNLGHSGVLERAFVLTFLVFIVFVIIGVLIIGRKPIRQGPPYLINTSNLNLKNTQN